MESRTFDLAEDASDYLHWLDSLRHRGLSSDQSSFEAIQSVCADALDRARACEVRQGSPFDAALISSLAVQIADSYSFIHPELREIAQAGGVLLSALHTLCDIRRKWGRRVSLAEYEVLRIEGVVSAFIEESEDGNIERTIAMKIRPALDKLGLNLDAILQGIVQETVANTLFSAEDDDDDDPAASHTFSRLVLITKAILNVQIRAETVLLLMQLPAIGSREEHHQAMQRLQLMAEELRDVSALRTREAISESLRLLKLQSVALKYGVLKFDIRSQQQVRAIAFLIATRALDSTALDDALMFAQSYLSPAAIYSRALISKAMEVEIAADERRERVQVVLRHLSQSSHYSMVVENSVETLLVTVKESTESMQSTESENFNSTTKSLIHVLTDSSIFLITQYLDNSKSEKSKKVQPQFNSAEINFELLSTLKSMQVLQKEHDIYLSIEEFRSEATRRSVVATLAGRVCENIVNNNSESIEFQNPLTPSIRRVCSLLKILPSSFLYFVIKKILVTESLNNIETALKLADILRSELRLCEEISEFDSSCVAESTKRLCSSSLKMPDSNDFRPYSISVEILRNFLEHCSPCDLGRILDLFSAADLFITVSERIDRNTLEAPLINANVFKISQSSYSRDGLLLRFEEIVKPISVYSIREIERRSQHGDANLASDDYLVTLISTLQEAEHHLICTRVILSSWSSSSIKPELLRKSLLCLCRKVLSYREIDVLLTVACLSCLAQDSVIRELKAVFPSMQDDLARLNCTAAIGEDLSRMWGKEDLLVLFETIQKNSHWIRVMRSMNVKVDPRLMQSTAGPKSDAYLRSLVPELLIKSDMNLDTISEFCAQYNIESDFATLCYIEQSLIRPPDSQVWTASLRQIASGANETALLDLLRRSLIKIHPVNYETILFVCSWLVDALTEDTVNQKANFSSPSLSVAFGAEISTYIRYTDIVSVLQTIQTKSPLVSAEKLPPAYANRIPLWPLLEDTFGMMERLISDSPGITASLLKICSILKLDEDRFQALKFKAIYESERDFILPTEDQSCFDEGFSKLWNHIKVIKSRLLRAQLLSWVFEKERRCRSTWATFVLEKSITQLSADGESEEEVDLRRENLTTLLRCRCEKSLQRLEHSTSMLPLSHGALDDPVTLPKFLLEKSLDFLWNLQLGSMEEGGGVIVSYEDLHHSRFTGTVMRACEAFSTALNETTGHLQELLSVDAKADLEKERKKMMLALALRKRDAFSAKDDFEVNALVSEGWIDPSPSELRRVVEVRCAFSVAALVQLCDSSKLRRTYLQHLHDVVVESSAKHNSLSRYRAAQALLFLGETGSENENFTAMRNFYFCLSDLEEVRLPFNRDAIYNGIVGDSSLLQMVLTWIHDDGYHADVTEVCRDLLLASHREELTAWQRLLSCMIQHRHIKALWHTIAILSTKSFFPSLIVDAYLQKTVDLMNDVLSEALERLQSPVNADNVSSPANGVSSYSLVAFTMNSLRRGDTKISLNLALALKRVGQIWNRLDDPLIHREKSISSLLVIWRALLEAYFNYFIRSSTQKDHGISSDFLFKTLTEYLNSTMRACTPRATDAETSFASEFLSKIRRAGAENGYSDEMFEIVCGLYKAFSTEVIHSVMNILEEEVCFLQWISQRVSSTWHLLQYRHTAKVFLLWISKR